MSLKPIAALLVALVWGSVAFADDPRPTIEKLRLPKALQGGYVEAGYVRLTGPAGEDGLMVHIVHDGDSQVQMPDRLFIKPGHSWGRFPMRASETVTRRRVLQVGVATREGGVADETQIMPVPAQSRTVYQRGVTMKFSPR